MKNVYHTAIAFDDTLRLSIIEPQLWLRVIAATMRLGHDVAACLHGCTCYKHLLHGFFFCTRASSLHYAAAYEDSLLVWQVDIAFQSPLLSKVRMLYTDRCAENCTCF
jgi:hypothetical protein